MRLAALVTASVLSVGIAQEASGQFAPGARATGMGGSGSVFATGVDAVELNPANLAWDGRWSVSLLELGGASLSSGATFSEILAIFGADFRGSGQLSVPQIVNGLPENGIGLSLVSEGYATAYAFEQGGVPRPGSPLPSFGATAGPFGLRVRSRVMLDFTLSRELADLIGNGFSESRIQEYRVGNTGYRSAAFSEVTASYAAKLGDRLSVGVGARYVKGHSLLDGSFFEPELDLTTSPRTLSVTSVAVESSSGSGFGLDLGLSLDLPSGVRASASATNIFQRMTWDEPLRAHTATYSDATLDANDFIDLIGQHDAQVVDATSVSLSVFQAAQDLFEGSFFPATYRGGVGFRNKGTSVELVGIRVSPRGRHRTAWDQRMSLGVEQQIPVVTLRAGLARAQDGVQALTGGVGLRLGPVHLDAAGGYFSGDQEVTVYDGYHVTFALQVVGGGS